MMIDDLKIGSSGQSEVAGEPPSMGCKALPRGNKTKFLHFSVPAALVAGDSFAGISKLRDS